MATIEANQQMPNPKWYPVPVEIRDRRGGPVIDILGMAVVIHLRISGLALIIQVITRDILLIHLFHYCTAHTNL